MHTASLRLLGRLALLILLLLMLLHGKMGSRTNQQEKRCCTSGAGSRRGWVASRTRLCADQVVKQVDTRIVPSAM
jgi:hypothetical protein